MSKADELYKEVILDHYRRPRHRGSLTSPPAAHARGYNPLCGDEIDVYVSVDSAGRIDEVLFEGKGCAISQASASMMTEQARGRTPAEFEETLERFKSLLGLGDETEEPAGPPDGIDPVLGDAVALTGVRQFPSRIKCATLAWNTLEQALAGRETFEESGDTGLT